MIDLEQISDFELNIVLNEILKDFSRAYPEYTDLARLQYFCGCRVNELFEPYRWRVVNDSYILLQPQKGNAQRVLTFEDCGLRRAADLLRTLSAADRLTRSQYERGLQAAISRAGLWRTYDAGFIIPSTHSLRHNRIKQLYAGGWSYPQIATWIGEKNELNLNYYIESKFYIEKKMLADSK